MKACKIDGQKFCSKQQAAIHLMYTTDMTYTQVSNKVGIKVPTVIQAQEQEIRRLERDVYKDADGNILPKFLD